MNIFLTMALFFTLTVSAYEDQRTIVVSGLSGSAEYETALKKLEKESAALKERDVKIETRKKDQFSISLYGKDGGEKWSGKSDFKVSDILSKIDEMPMRQDEMKGRKK